MAARNKEMDENMHAKMGKRCEKIDNHISLIEKFQKGV